ncbi:MAG: hypothetical protein WCE80_09100 [Acidimicrobiia bacterium]
MGVIVALAFGAAAGIAGADQVEDPGCLPAAEASIVESQEFTPAEATRGQVVDALPLRAENAPTIDPPIGSRVPGDVLDGHPLQWATSVAGGSLYQYFSDLPIDSKTSYDQFMSTGGVQFDREPADGGDFAAYLISNLGDRVTPIDVGRFRGALVWADPLPSGVRTHNLYWFDGEYNNSLIGDLEPHTIVDLGRSLVCSTP